MPIYLVVGVVTVLLATPHVGISSERYVQRTCPGVVGGEYWVDRLAPMLTETAYSSFRSDNNLVLVELSDTIAPVEDGAVCESVAQAVGTLLAGVDASEYMLDVIRVGPYYLAIIQPAAEGERGTIIILAREGYEVLVSGLII